MFRTVVPDDSIGSFNLDNIQIHTFSFKYIFHAKANVYESTKKFQWFILFMCEMFLFKRQ